MWHAIIALIRVIVVTSYAPINAVRNGVFTRLFIPIQRHFFSYGVYGNAFINRRGRDDLYHYRMETNKTRSRRWQICDLEYNGVSLIPNMVARSLPQKPDGCSVKRCSHRLRHRISGFENSRIRGKVEKS